jgi:hypothetical protein
MPVVFRHSSFRFFFYSNDGDPREPLHIHVRSPVPRRFVWKPTVRMAGGLSPAGRG